MSLWRQVFEVSCMLKLPPVTHCTTSCCMKDVEFSSPVHTASCHVEPQKQDEALMLWMVQTQAPLAKTVTSLTLRLQMTPPKQVEKTFRPIQVLSPLLSQVIQSHTPLSSGFKSPNAIQVSFPSFPDNKIWIPIISTEYDLEGKKK